MAIPTEIETALADRPDVLTFVKGLDAKADKFTPDIEKALPDLAKLPELMAHSAAVTKLLTETKAKDADTLLADFKNLKSINADLISQRDANKGKTGDVTKTPEYLALEEKLTNATNDFTTRFKTLEDTAKADKDAKAAAILSQRKTDLKSAVISAAAGEKIRKPDDEFLLLEAKGLVGHKEDGTPFFFKLNEKGEKVDAGSAAGLMKWIAETDKAKVDPSAKTGTGQEHKGNGGGSGDVPMTAKDARRAFMS